MQFLPSAKGYLVDLDGTLIRGGCALAGAAQLIEAVGERMVLVSNDSEHLPERLADMLARLKLYVPAERIVLAGTSAIDMAATAHPGGRIMLLADTRLAGYARRAGLIVTARRPDCVVLMRDRAFTYAKLQNAVLAVQGGAELIVANPDLAHPGARGPVPETGALLRALLACTGDIAYQVIGKPEPALFQAGLAILGIGPADAVMIGDNKQTDGAGAAKLGMAYLDVSAGFPWANDDTRQGPLRFRRASRGLAFHRP